MRDSLWKVRAEIRRHKRRRAHPSVHYPREMRRRIVGLVRSEQARGTGLLKLARELGVSVNTLRRWREEPEVGRGLEKIVLVEDARRPGNQREHALPVLVTRQGHRVEGLDMESLAKLLEALS